MALLMCLLTVIGLIPGAAFAAQSTVTIESQTNGFSDHLTALSAAAASNDMPDMAMLQGAYYQQFVDGDLLVDLMPYVESGALDLSNVSESVLAATTIDGKLYGVCAGTNSPSVIYNKTLLDEAGITGVYSSPGLSSR